MDTVPAPARSANSWLAHAARWPAQKPGPLAAGRSAKPGQKCSHRRGLV